MFISQFHMTSSANIPDGFSTEQLLEMLQEAQPEAIAHDLANAKELDGPIAGRTVEEVKMIAEAALDTCEEECKSGVMVIAVIEEALTRLMVWHRMSAHRMFEQGMEDQSGGWSRDAGKLQAVANILSTIDCGDGDFTFGKNSEDN